MSYHICAAKSLYAHFSESLYLSKPEIQRCARAHATRQPHAIAQERHEKVTPPPLRLPPPPLRLHPSHPRSQCTARLLPFTACLSPLLFAACLWPLLSPVHATLTTCLSPSTCPPPPSTHVYLHHVGGVPSVPGQEVRASWASIAVRSSAANSKLGTLAAGTSLSLSLSLSLSPLRQRQRVATGGCRLILQIPLDHVSSRCSSCCCLLSLCPSLSQRRCLSLSLSLNDNVSSRCSSCC